MSTLELKEKLISRILQTENKPLLDEVFRLLGPEEEEAEILQLSPQQRQAILEGLDDVENGRFLTNEQADKEIREWLKK